MYVSASMQSRMSFRSLSNEINYIDVLCLNDARKLNCKRSCILEETKKKKAVGIP
jgi:hypothetical protein